MSIQIVEIDFEVGHSSIIRSEPTTNHIPPRTHDWKVFLRSADIHGDLSCLIHRCIFHLHPEYSNHKRGRNILNKEILYSRI
jgi:transcription initiation factor IIF auxiliary subunit